MSLEHLSDTAYWIAYLRSLESDRPDALFKDPYSRQLAGHLGETISHWLGSIDLIATSIAVRTSVMDSLILDMVPRLNIDLVLNIGSGLDTRPWRLPLPPQLRWLDVDPSRCWFTKPRPCRNTPPGANTDPWVPTFSIPVNVAPSSTTLPRQAA